MSQVFLIDPFKDERWDRFVESHLFGWICHLSGWRRVLENSFPHIKGYYLALINENDEIKAGLPVYEVRSWFRGNRLVSIPFATISDPLIYSSDEIQKFIYYMKIMAKELKINNIEIRTTNSSPLIKHPDFSEENYFKIHYINLNHNINELWKSFHRKAVRQEINRASKSNLNFKIAETERDLIEFYNLYLDTRKRLGLPPQTYNFFKILWNEFRRSGKLHLYLARYKDQTIAGHIVFRFNGRVSAEFEGWDRRFYKLSPNHFLFWEEIKLAYADGFKIYDFGRTSPRNLNLMNFKKHWGTDVRDLPIFYFKNGQNNKKILNEDRILYNVARKICKSTPHPLFKYIGDFFYRHLS